MRGQKVWESNVALILAWFAWWIRAPTNAGIAQIFCLVCLNKLFWAGLEKNKNNQRHSTALPCMNLPERLAQCLRHQSLFYLYILWYKSVFRTGKLARKKRQIWRVPSQYAAALRTIRPTHNHTKQISNVKEYKRPPLLLQSVLNDPCSQTHCKKKF